MESSRLYQIFISSTFEDLKEHRKALIDEILRLGHIPSGMELFSAGDLDEFEVIKRAIDQSDIYIVLLGAMYGSIRDGSNPPLSYTQMEYEYARNVAKKPCLTFLLDEADFTKRRQEITYTNEPDAQFQDSLLAFRREAKRGQIVDFFPMKNPSKLVVSFQSALLKTLTGRSNTPRDLMGYIRATELEDLHSQARLFGKVGQAEIMRDVVQQLNKFTKLASRMNERANMKRDLAAYFWDNFAGPIFGAGYRNLFFESGSTLAYLSTALLTVIKNNPSILVTPSRDEERLKIRTNNILTYLTYVLDAPVKTSLVPYGPPDKKYGATYGEIAHHFSDDIPKHPQSLRKSGLVGEERNVLNRIIEEALIWEKHKTRRHIFLAAASGLELRNKNELYRGPHVGTYRNMLLKRAMYETGSPLILFLDDAKIDQNFDPEVCYSVMSRERTWTQFCAENPLAVCFACKDEVSYQETVVSLRASGFLPHRNEPVVFQSDQVSPSYCGLMANMVFFKQFDELSPSDEAAETKNQNQ